MKEQELNSAKAGAAGHKEREVRNHMEDAWLDEFLLSFQGAAKDYKEEWQWTRYLLDGKMFAAICNDKEGRKMITLKLKPMDGDFLRREYADIVPGYYMNKEHWNSVYLNGAVPRELIKELAEKSYHLIFEGLSKKRQKEILNRDE